MSFSLSASQLRDIADAVDDLDQSTNITVDTFKVGSVSVMLTRSEDRDGPTGYRIIGLTEGNWSHKPGGTCRGGS